MNNIGYTSKDLLNLAQYATGAGINHYDLELGSGVAGYLLFDGSIKGSKWLIDNKKKIKDKGFWRTLQKSIKANEELQKALKGHNILETSQNFYRKNTIKELSEKYKPFKKLPAGEAAKLTGKARLEYLQKIAKSGYYDDVRKLISQAEKLSGDAYKLKMNEVYEAIAKADLNVHNAKLTGELAPITKRGKLIKGLKDITGINKAGTKVKELAVSSKGLRTVSKAVKGNALFAGISLLAEAPEIAETYTKLGAGAGNKQLARSVVNVAAETAGFAIGMKAGAAMGAAIGTCIPIPGVGTAVGAVIGAAVGFVGSWLAGKASRSIVGESELEQKKNYDAKVIALKAKFDKNVEQSLLEATREKLSQETNRENSEVIASFNKIIQTKA